MYYCNDYLQSLFFPFFNFFNETKAAKQDKPSAYVARTIMYSMKDIIETIPQFVTPYSQKFITCLLHKSLFTTPSTVSVPKDILKVISGRLPARILVPSLITSLQYAIDNGTQSLLTLYAFVENILKNMNRDSIAALHKEMYQFFLLSFDIRRTNVSQLSSEV